MEISHFLILLLILFILPLYFLYLELGKKLLHNFGKSGWWLLLIIPEITIVYLICSVEYKLLEKALVIFIETPYIRHDLASIITVVSFLLILGFLPYLLVFLPESKLPNQYGLPRGSLNIDPNDKFLVFFVNILRKCHLISPEQEIKKNEGENE